MVNTEWRVVENYNNYGGTWFVLPMAELAFRIEDDGRFSNLFLAAAAPQGGLPRGVSNIPALAKGDRGFAPTLVLGDFEELAYNDPTEGRLTIDLVSEGTDVSGPVYQLNGALHGGQPGEDGAAIITPSDYGETPQYGQALTVAPGESTFELTWPKVAGFHLPSSISGVVAATGESTMAVFSVEAGTYNFDWRPVVRGNAITTSTGNIQVDLIARLNGESDGDIIARGFGMATTSTWQPNLVTKIESGTGIVSAGEAAEVYVRTKRISGSVAYAASANTAAFEMLAVAV